jgi:hypothetical protein
MPRVSELIEKDMQRSDESNSHNTTDANRPAVFGHVTRAHRTMMAVIGIGLLAVSLAACAPTGPEPVPLDQNPGSNGAPTSSGS